MTVPRTPAAGSGLRQRAGLAVALVVVLITATGCAGGSEAPASRIPVALGVPVQQAEEPIREAKLVPGTRYLFRDVVPGLLDLEVTAPTPAVYNYSDAAVAVLSTSPQFEVDALWFIDVPYLGVPTDPYFDAASIAGQQDLERAIRSAPSDLLGYFAGLPFARVSTPERSVTVSGLTGRAVDLRIRRLPPEAAACAYGAIRRCATITLLPGIGQVVQTGQRYRIIVLRVETHPVLITQNLRVPGTQTILDSISFVPTT